MSKQSAARELNIGRKIRKLRKEGQLTLQELSILSGLSKPLLSQIENDQVIPPIATAKGLIRMILDPGDSIYYDSSEAHGYISLGSERAKAVAVLYLK